jgi:hypothetical protein
MLLEKPLTHSASLAARLAPILLARTAAFVLTG